MIGIAGYFQYINKKDADFGVTAKARLKVTE